MRMLPAVLTVATTLACATMLAACQSASPQAQTAAPTPVQDAAWVPEARGVATEMPKKLLDVLVPAMQKDGAAGAIGVCNAEAPKMAKAASERTGWQIRRVSLNNRNPKAVPDAWEKATLEAFDKAQASGANPATLERAEVVTENGKAVRRYMRALPTQQLCLQCHGTPDKLGAGVAQKLTQLYPNDKATGYTLGQIRGAITLRQPVKP